MVLCDVSSRFSINHFQENEEQNVSFTRDITGNDRHKTIFS